MDFDLSREQKDIQRAARDFAVGEFTDVARDYDLHETFPMEILNKARRLGFIGLFIPEAYGGPGFGFLEQARPKEKDGLGHERHADSKHLLFTAAEKSGLPGFQMDRGQEKFKDVPDHLPNLSALFQIAGDPKVLENITLPERRDVSRGRAQSLS